MTLTRERLEQYAFDDRMCNVNDEIREMARRLLAAEAQEPVAYMIGGYYLMHAHDPKVDNYASAVPLYAAPQPVAVPDERATFSRDAFYEIWDSLVKAHPNSDEADIGSIAWNVLGPTAYEAACRAAMLQPSSGALQLPDDTKRLDWLDAQNKRLNEYYGTSYGWKFDANFQRNAMMLNDSNYPVMNVRRAIDEAMRTAPQEPTK